MMVGSFVQAPAPQPRIWRSLGMIRPGLQGFYAIGTLHDRATPDVETSLRGSAYNIVDAHVERGAGVPLLGTFFTVPARNGSEHYAVLFDTWPSMAGVPLRPISMQLAN